MYAIFSPCRNQVNKDFESGEWVQVGFSPNPMMYGRVEPRRLKEKEETLKPSLRFMTTNGHPPFL
tara:strand:- start:20 stop:214 length:195 start_codon:yes stop_codon:yes gene_type:complete